MWGAKSRSDPGLLVALAAAEQKVGSARARGCASMASPALDPNGLAGCATVDLILQVSKHSSCPSGLWHDRISPLLSAPNMVILNVGANKGYNLVEYAQRYTRTNVTKSAWFHLLTNVASPKCETSCLGTCGGSRDVRAKRHKRPAPAAEAGATVHRLELHAFELMPANGRLLQQLVTATGLPAEVHRTGVSNASGTMLVQVRPGGSEKGMLVPWSLAGVPSTTTVPVTTIDAFMEARDIERAQLVSIDTEGSDGLVLQGMSRTLAARKADVVDFEYSTMWAKWSGRHGLRDALAQLVSAGYACFWQDDRGMLAETSGACWSDLLANLNTPPAWRNLVCSHRPDVLRTLRGLDIASKCTHCATCPCSKTSKVCRSACEQGKTLAVPGFNNTAAPQQHLG